MSDAEQLSLFAEGMLPPPTTMPPHDESPVEVQWVTDADGHVRCQIAAECGCEGEVAQTAKRFTTHDEWTDAVDEAVILTAQAIVELLSDHDDEEDVFGTLHGIMWVIKHHTLLRTGWETAMPFTAR